MRLPFYAAACSLALIACESDEEKLRRLKSEEAINSLRVLRAQRRFDSATQAGAPDSVISMLRDSLLHAEDRHDLTRRELERFMR